MQYFMEEGGLEHLDLTESQRRAKTYKAHGTSWYPGHALEACLSLEALMTSILMPLGSSWPEDVNIYCPGREYGVRRITKT
jgi:hypothetical protein